MAAPISSVIKDLDLNNNEEPQEQNTNNEIPQEQGTNNGKPQKQDTNNEPQDQGTGEEQCSTEQAEGHKATEETSDKDEMPKVVDQMPQVVDPIFEIVDELPEGPLTDEQMRQICQDMNILLISTTDSLEGLFEFSKI